MPGEADLEAARGRLLDSLREQALILGEVTLTSGRLAQYYVDVKRAILLPAGFTSLAMLVAAQAAEWGATAVGGMTMGADPIACAALAGGAPVTIPDTAADASGPGGPSVAGRMADDEAL